MEPHDDLSKDDSFAFSIERLEPRKVLFLYAAGRSRDAYYYRSSMDASKATGLSVETFPIERVSAEDLSKCAFVVLDNPGALEENLERTLSAYVARGGAALIAVGPSTNRAGKIPVAGNEVMATRETQGAGDIDGQSAALAGIGNFQNVQFVGTSRITPNQNDRVLARFADGSPMLIDQRAGEGRIVTFASTLDNSTSDFPLHTSFLPFVVQIGAYLSGAEDTPSSMVIGTPISLRRTRAQSTAADVTGPDGKHELNLAEATRVMSYDPDREGFYEVQRASGQRVLLAVNADRRESDLTPVPSETLALWRNTGTRTDDPVSLGERENVPRSLWRFVLELTLIAALVESIFASRYLKEERQIS